MRPSPPHLAIELQRQLNETGLAGRAALIAVVDMHKSGAISRKRVTELIRPYHLKQLTSDTIDQGNFSTLSTFSPGVAVLPRSAVSARVYFTGDAALRAKTQDEKVCLCKKTFVPIMVQGSVTAGSALNRLMVKGAVPMKLK